jgi:hypothetical protein
MATPARMSLGSPVLLTLNSAEALLDYWLLQSSQVESH